jgi:hypothetical protein
LFEHDLSVKPVPTFPDHALPHCLRRTISIAAIMPHGIRSGKPRGADEPSCVFR